MENHTARHFVLQLGSLASLYLSLSFLLVLIFGVINLAFPDATNGYWEIESAHQGVRIGFAMVIVFFPTYLILTRTVNKLRRTETSGAYLSLTKWLVYLSLLVGGGVLLGDLVTVIMTFLEGEITQRFILKAAAVFVVIGAAFHYYILDARGFWLKNEAKSVQFAYGAIAVVIASLAYGFTSIEAPTEVLYDIELHYYVGADDEGDAIINIEGEDGAIERFIEWQSAALKRDINPDELKKHILMPSWSVTGIGANRAEITLPLYQVIGIDQVARFSGTISVTHEVI